MAEREALWGWDLDESPAEPSEPDHRNGHDPSTDPIPVIDVEGDEQPFATHPDDVDDRDTSYARPFIERAVGSPIGTLTFKPAPRPWYRRKPGAIVVASVAAAALTLAILALVRSPSSTPEEPGPAPPTSGAPSAESPPPSVTRPTMSNPPAPPPPPPPPPAPPPPPPLVQDTAPAYTPYYPPRNSSPSQADRPQRDVTRAPMSVAPEIKAPPPDEAKVGEGRPDRGFF